MASLDMPWLVKKLFILQIEKTTRFVEKGKADQATRTIQNLIQLTEWYSKLHIISNEEKEIILGYLNEVEKLL